MLGAAPVSSLRKAPTAAKLRSTRRHLFEEGRTAAFPSDLVAWQWKVLQTLLDAEQWPRGDARRRHESRCRLMADELVWRQMHPHAIRIQSWWSRPRPGLSSQLPGLRLTFEVAQILAAKGIPPIVTDLTSCLTSGDLLGVVDRERPAIIECKARSIRGRRDSRSNRQANRYRRQAQHLRQGGTHDTDTGIDHVVVETGPVGKSLDGFIRSCAVAMNLGRGLVVLPPDEAYLALKRRKANQSVDDLFEIISAEIPSPRHPIIATTFHMNDEPDPRWPPPSFWLADVDAAEAVLENEILVTRFADVGELVDAAGENARFVDDVIVAEDETGQVAWQNVIGMVMNGFDSVGATAAWMRSQTHVTNEDLGADAIDRRRADWAAQPATHTEITLSDLRTTDDLSTLLSAPLVVFQS
jgi:hypothetical protein